MWLTEQLLSRFAGRIAHISTEVMLVWGQLTGALEKRGKPLPAMDSLIAAIALTHHFSLVTRNVTDFENTGVSIVNPWRV